GSQLLISTSASFASWYHADRTIILEQRGAHLFNTAASGFAQSGHHFMTGKFSILQSLFKKLAIADEHFRPAFDQSLQFLASISENSNDPVDSDQGRCGNHPADHGIVATVHGVLNGITQDQEQDQIERRQLADLSFAG